MKNRIPLITGFVILILTFLSSCFPNFRHSNFLKNIEGKYWRVISIKVHDGYTLSADTSHILYCPYFTITKVKGSLQYITNNFCNETRGKLEFDKNKISLVGGLTTRVRCGQPSLQDLNRARSFLQKHLTDSISKPSLLYFLSRQWNYFNMTKLGFKQVDQELYLWNDSADTAKLIQVKKDKYSTYIKHNYDLP